MANIGVLFGRDGSLYKDFSKKKGLELFLKNDKEFLDIFNSLNQISEGTIISIKRFNQIINQNFGLY